VLAVRDTRRTRIALAALLAVALALIAADYLGLTGLRAAGGAVFGTAERALASVGGRITGPSARVRSLERQLITLRAQLSGARLSKAEYAQLARLLRLSGQGGYRIVVANVIALGQGYQRTVTLDAGSRDGVRPEETVLNGSGLVGTVTSVSPWTSTVVLATDPSAVAGVRLVGGGQLGWVTGAPGAPGSGLLRLRVLGPSTVLAPGEQVVTAASQGGTPYVAGVPVGIVVRVQAPAGTLTGTALVRPFVDFAALDVVGVVVARRGS
jgi:rod shape-determining protein MreC